jgi:5'-methylthioadenosine phosphorylase
MRVGLISGTGGYTWPGLEGACGQMVGNRYGEVILTESHIGGVEVVHLCRHGTGHARLSNQIEHWANLAALLDAGVDAVISTTVCGALHPGLGPGSLVVFDDLYFPSNRLPDGSPCTWHDRPGKAGRAHWIFDRPFSEPIRQAPIDAPEAVGVDVQPRGCYGHVDGPRFNCRTEIAALAAALGVVAVNQTLGPEVVLAGEAGQPMAAVGYVTDYTNGIGPAPEPLEAMAGRLADAPRVLASVVAEALGRLDKPTPSGTVYRFDR